MGLFKSRGNSGGVMNVIRCDLPEYLIWKWRPEGQALNSTTRENSIRYGSSLRVKDGEVAVFVYRQKDGTMQDFIVGPYDDTIKTANFPVLSSIVGMAFGGESPFQAEIYFINLAGNIQLKFGIPYFDIADPRYLDFVVPIAAGGTLTFNIADYLHFIKLNRMQNFELEDFKKQISDAVKRRVKSTISNAPAEYNFPLIQIERKIEEINDNVYEKLSKDLYNDFGVNLKRLDISRIEVDKESEGWKELKLITTDQQKKTILAQSEINLRNLDEMQRINSENMKETLRIQREEAQRAQRLQSESQFIGAHALNRQSDVLMAAANNLGQMASMGGGAGGGGGMNPASMMAGIALGGAVGQQMSGMMGQMGTAMTGQMQGGVGTQQPVMNQMQPGMNQMQPGMGAPAMPGQVTPPPPPVATTWMLAVNGQQCGPYDMNQMQQYVASGHLTRQTYVWRQGMPNWEIAGNVPELTMLFGGGNTPPPAAPGVPPMP